MPYSFIHPKSSFLTCGKGGGGGRGSALQAGPRGEGWGSPSYLRWAQLWKHRLEALRERPRLAHLVQLGLRESPLRGTRHRHVEDVDEDDSSERLLLAICSHRALGPCLSFLAVVPVAPVDLVVDADKDAAVDEEGWWLAVRRHLVDEAERGLLLWSPQLGVGISKGLKHSLADTTESVHTHCSTQEAHTRAHKAPMTHILYICVYPFWAHESSHRPAPRCALSALYSFHMAPMWGGKSSLVGMRSWAFKKSSSHVRSAFRTTP